MHTAELDSTVGCTPWSKIETWPEPIFHFLTKDGPTQLHTNPHDLIPQQPLPPHPSATITPSSLSNPHPLIPQQTLPPHPSATITTLHLSNHYYLTTQQPLHVSPQQPLSPHSSATITTLPLSINNHYHLTPQ